MHIFKTKRITGKKRTLKQRGLKYFAFEMPIKDVRKMDAKAIQLDMNRSEFVRFVLDKNGVDDVGIDWNSSLSVPKVHKRVKPLYRKISPVEYRKIRGKKEVLLEMPLTLLSLIERTSGKKELSCASVVRSVLKKELGR